MDAPDPWELPTAQDEPVAEEGHQDGATDQQQLLGHKGRAEAEISKRAVRTRSATLPRKSIIDRASVSSSGE